MTDRVKKCPWCSRELTTKVIVDKEVCAFCGYKIRTLPQRPVQIKEEPKPLMVTPVEIPVVNEKPIWPMYVAIGLGVVIVFLLVKWFWFK